MPELTLRIGGRDYTVTCGQGEEEHVRNLGRYVDGKAHELTQALGSLGEGRLFLLVSLMLADEVADLRGTVDSLRGAETERAQAGDAFAESLENLAGRVETIVQKLETS